MIAKKDFYDGNVKIEYIERAKEALVYLKNNDVDILFLDISMPETDGFEIAKTIYNDSKNICLIFVSNYDEKVFYSFRYEPFRFVRKSNYKEEVREALQSAVYKIVLSNKTLRIKMHTDILYLRIQNIYYIEKEKMKNYVIIYMENTKYRHRSSINDLKLQLSDFSFLEAGQNTLINPIHIKKIEKNTVILNNGQSLTLPLRNCNRFKSEYLIYMRER